MPKDNENKSDFNSIEADPIKELKQKQAQGKQNCLWISLK